MNVPVLYLDIDGTVRHGKTELGYFVNTPDDVVIFPEAVILMRRWKNAGGRIVGISNQGGIGLGHLTIEACTAAMQRTYDLTDQLFDDIHICHHHPTARCGCRKPAPGLLAEARTVLAQRHPGETYPKELALMVGDRDEDQACARAAGIDFQWAADWRAWIDVAFL